MIPENEQWAIWYVLGLLVVAGLAATLGIVAESAAQDHPNKKHLNEADGKGLAGGTGNGTGAGSAGAGGDNNSVRDGGGSADGGPGRGERKAKQSKR